MLSVDAAFESLLPSANSIQQSIPFGIFGLSIPRPIYISFCPALCLSRPQIYTMRRVMQTTMGKAVGAAARAVKLMTMFSYTLVYV